MDLTPKQKQVIAEWKEREKKYEMAKKELRDVLNRHGVASSEFSSAKIDFEMIKEEFDNFEKEHAQTISAYQR